MNPFHAATLFALLSAPAATADDSHPSHASPPGGGGFLEPFEHLHFSALGTPFVHSFGIEPAFTGRDLFLDYRYRRGDDVTEHEIEMELEWAFTRRLGVIVEVPYLFEDAGAGATADGFGDLAIVPRALLVEQDRFLLTAQVEVVAPTGTGGLGGETAIAPGIATWHDLGSWWTLNSQLAVEHVFEEDATAFGFGFGLVKSFGRGERPAADSHGHGSPAGGVNLHLEVTGSVGLEGEDEGVLTAEGLLGISYGLTGGMDVRLGYEFPLSSPREFNGGVVAGLIWHF